MLIQERMNDNDDNVQCVWKSKAHIGQMNWPCDYIAAITVVIICMQLIIDVWRAERAYLAV